MPPKKQLSEKQIAIFQAWVDTGAEWDEKALQSFGQFAEADKLGELPPGVQPSYALSLSPDSAKLAMAQGTSIKVMDATKPERADHRDAYGTSRCSAIAGVECGSKMDRRGRLSHGVGVGHLELAARAYAGEAVGRTADSDDVFAGR